MDYCGAGVFGPKAKGCMAWTPVWLREARGTYTCGKNAPMTPQDYVQQKAAASGSSFYYAFLFLPAERAPPSPPFMRSAARWTMWSTR